MLPRVHSEQLTHSRPGKHRQHGRPRPERGRATVRPTPPPHHGEPVPLGNRRSPLTKPGLPNPRVPGNDDKLPPPTPGPRKNPRENPQLMITPNKRGDHANAPLMPPGPSIAQNTPFLQNTPFSQETVKPHHPVVTTRSRTDLKTLPPQQKPPPTPQSSHLTPTLSPIPQPPNPTPSPGPPPSSTSSTPPFPGRPSPAAPRHHPAAPLPLATLPPNTRPGVAPPPRPAHPIGPIPPPPRLRHRLAAAPSRRSIPPPHHPPDTPPRHPPGHPAPSTGRVPPRLSPPTPTNLLYHATTRHATAPPLQRSHLQRHATAASSPPRSRSGIRRLTTRPTHRVAGPAHPPGHATPIAPPSHCHPTAIPPAPASLPPAASTTVPAPFAPSLSRHLNAFDYHRRHRNRRAADPSAVTSLGPTPAAPTCPRRSPTGSRPGHLPP